MKNSQFSQVSIKKVIFEAKKIISTTCQTRLNIFLVHGQENAKLKIMPWEWSRYLIYFFFNLARKILKIVKIENREKTL